MRITLKLAAAAATCALLFACANDKVPAQAALTAAQQAITAVSADAQKYVPEKLKETQNALADAKDQFQKENYKGALASANEVAKKAKALGAAIDAKKEEMTKTWTEMNAQLPKALADLKSRMDVLTKTKKLPKGMNAAAFTQAKDDVAAQSKLMEEASTAFATGYVAEAVERGNMVKEKVNELMGALGMQPAVAPVAAAKK